MPSIGSILSVAKTALQSQQEAINVTAHNIANAATVGYSRQRALVTSLPPLHTATGVFGTGVQVLDVERVRDIYLDSSFRSESGELGEQQVRSGVLGQVETLLSEPGEGGLSKSLDQFFSAWSDLATSPTSTTARGAVRAQAESLTAQIRSLAGSLDALRQNTLDRLDASVERVNALAGDVARLNREITTIEAGGGGTVGDLRDARDRAIDEMSTLIPVQVLERDSGSVGVLTSGFSLVDAAAHGSLEIRTTGGVVGLALVGHPSTISDLGGSIGGMVALLNVDLPDARTSLDDLAEALVTDINTIHQTGTSPDGSTGVDFFDPTGILASTIELSAAVAVDLQKISAGADGGSGNYLAGNNDIALSLSSLRDAPSGTLGTSLSDHLRSLVTDVGFSVRSSLDQLEVHQTLSEQAGTRRSSFNGVSTDEELVLLIQFQTAYSAAARVVSVADEMLDTLVRM